MNISFVSFSACDHPYIIRKSKHKIKKLEDSTILNFNRWTRLARCAYYIDDKCDDLRRGIKFIWKHMENSLVVTYSLIKAIEKNEHLVFDPFDQSSMNLLEEKLREHVDHNIVYINGNFVLRISSVTIRNMMGTANNLSKKRFSITPIEQLPLVCIPFIEQEIDDKFKFTNIEHCDRLIATMVACQTTPGKVIQCDRTQENKNLRDTMLSNLQDIDMQLFYDTLAGKY